MEGGNSVMNQHFQEIEALRLEREKAHEEGIPALKRLLPIAQGHSGQCKSVARFLLSLYNGYRFPLDLRELRRIDAPIFADFIIFTIFINDLCPHHFPINFLYFLFLDNFNILNKHL